VPIRVRRDFSCGARVLLAFLRFMSTFLGFVLPHGHGIFNLIHLVILKKIVPQILKIQRQRI
jgi:hypothetical protein